MIGKTISRIASILVGTVFMMGMIPTGVWAAGEPAGGAVSAGIIDTGMTGSITVHKTDAESGEGIPGAVFNIAQVGAITTVSAAEGTGTYVTDLDGTLQSIFEGCGAMPEPAGDGETEQKGE